VNLEKAREDLWEKVATKSEPVDPQKILRYERDLSDNYAKYVIESRAVAKKTAEMSKRICVA
jgi:hypothetical protein